MTPGILYISYDGMLEPLGQSQVLAYLERLAVGRRIHLMSFEKPADWADAGRRAELARRISDAGLHWHPMRYHKSPSAPATAYDIAAGSLNAISLCRRYKLGMVHARSYVAGLMALAAKRTTGARLLFDMRGFWADERVDGGMWPAGGSLYRAAKGVERRLLLSADHVVTLTHASAKELARWTYLEGKMSPVTVIPTCADLDRFTIQGPPRRQPFVLGYVGSVGTWYLLDEMLAFFVLLREQRDDARLLFVNRREHALVQERCRELQIPPESVEVVAADHAEVPGLIGGMSAGMALIRPTYSKIASAATKVAEYLGCGVPCVGNSGIGDMDEILADGPVGITLPDTSNGALKRGVEQLLALCREDDLQSRCRAKALACFSLDEGVRRYSSIYDALSSARS